MSAGKKYDIPSDFAHTVHYAIATFGDLPRRLTLGAAVAEQLPARTFSKYVCAKSAFVTSLVPFDQVVVQFSYLGKTGEFARPHGRCKGLVNTLAKVRPSRRAPSLRAFASPRSVSGRSVRPVCWPVIVHAVSPWRARYTIGKVSLTPAPSAGPASLGRK
jgi:hypothetical protein